MARYAVKCERTVTFYIDVIAPDQWEAQHKAEYIMRHDDGITKGGYGVNTSVVTARSGVNLDEEEEV